MRLQFNIGYVANDDIPAPRIEGSGGVSDHMASGRAGLQLTDAVVRLRPRAMPMASKAAMAFPCRSNSRAMRPQSLETEHFPGRGRADFEKVVASRSMRLCAGETRRSMSRKPEATGRFAILWLGRIGNAST